MWGKEAHKRNVLHGKVREESHCLVELRLDYYGLWFIVNIHRIRKLSLVVVHTVLVIHYAIMLRHLTI